MVTVKWAPFPATNIVSYRIWRSMIGFMGILPPDVSALAGKTLILRDNGRPNATTITLNGTSSIIAQINAVAHGFRAFQSSAYIDAYYVRSTMGERPGSLEILGGTALADLGLTVRMIVEQSEDVLVDTIPANPDREVLLEYEDADGNPLDWYRISAIDSDGVESEKSNYRQHLRYITPVCLIEGMIVDLQGLLVPDAEISAKLISFPHSPEGQSYATLEPVVARTGSDGRFSLVLAQRALVELKIPAIGFLRSISVPEKPFVVVNDLQVDLDYQFPLGYLDAPGAPSTDTGT